MDHPNYYNYYVETLTSTMTDAIIRNVSLQASVRVNDEVSRDYEKNLELLDGEIGRLKDELEKERINRNNSENSTISDLRKQVDTLNTELNEIRDLRSEYEQVKHQVQHVETFRKELSKCRENNELLKSEYELKIKELQEKIDYLQLTPAKRKKYDESKNQPDDTSMEINTEVSPIRDGGSF